MPENRSFESEVAGFQQFLGTNHWPDKIAWIQTEDLLVTGTRLLYARIPASEAREIAARQTFEQGITQGRGVLLAGCFELQGTSFCFVWVPANDDEARRALMPVGVKLSVPTDRVPVKRIRSPLLWWWLTFRMQRKQSNKEWLFQ
ncbi:MAG TPA: hypothetical protein VJN89_05770 [Candidatus Acidoferrum sp.]|nr:hypothetical protein [Candidatus Acidoferrum sp.]